MKRAAPLVLAFLAACSAPERPWEKPWPHSPVTDIESKPRLPNGRYAVDLVTVLRLAGANSLDVALVREKVREAYARTELANERFIPWIGPVFTFRRHEGSTQGTAGEFVDVDKQQAFVGGDLHLHWEVGDALFASLAASRRYDASLESLRGVENSVMLQAAIAYFDLLREQRRALVEGQSVKIDEDLAAQLQRAVDAKRAFRGDVLRARVRAANAGIARERALEGQRQAAIRLGSLLRLSPGIELEAMEQDLKPFQFVSPSALEADLVRDALESRPEIRGASVELAATRHARTGAVWGPLIPSIDAGVAPGGLGPTVGNLEGSTDYVLALGWRLGPGGILDWGRRHLADARVRQAEIELERVRQRVVDEVRSAWTQLNAASKILELARLEVQEAEEALRLNQERQTANIGLPLEVLQAEEALTRARLDLDTALVEFNQAQLRLRAALGRRPE